jgi:serine/threonine protein kinase
MDDRTRHIAGTAKPIENIHEPSLGENIDGFFLKELLSEQPVNNLFRVTHPEHDLPMVMKVPKLGIVLPATAFTAFETEMRILSRLHGVYTPPVIAKGDLGTCPYFVMEYIEGDALSQAVKKAPVAIDQLTQLMIPVCKAVHELHRHNIVHLDIKPGNIRNRADDSVVILDFGTAHHADMPDLYDDPHKKAPHTIDYVAPEQLHNIRNDSRSDVYALGVILYQLATGRLPFAKANLVTVNKRLYLPPTPPRAINADVPAWLQEVILKCLERLPDNRFSSAKQLAYVLSHPSMVMLSKRSELTQKTGLLSIARSWLHSRRDDFHKSDQLRPHERISSAPHILVALDLDNSSDELQQVLRNTIQRLAEMDKQSFFTVMTIVERNDLSGVEDITEVVEREHPTHVHHQTELRHWMKPLKLPASRINYQVIEGPVANEIIAYSKYHVIDNIVIGARGSSTLRRIMGSVSTKVVAEAPCTVTVVRTRRDNQNIQ